MMKVDLVLLVLGGALSVGCLGKIGEPIRPPPCDAGVPNDERVDSCVENVHTRFACESDGLPGDWSAIDCDGAPKKMHTQTGTLLVRDNGREDCTETVDYLGERLLCCPPAVVR